MFSNQCSVASIGHAYVITVVVHQLDRRTLDPETKARRILRQFRSGRSSKSTCDHARSKGQHHHPPTFSLHMYNKVPALHLLGGILGSR